MNTRPESERYKVLLPAIEREKLPENSTDVFYLNIIDYYINRPDELEHLSLFKFASYYKSSSSETVNVSSKSQKRIKLKNLNKILQLRRKPVIIRTPKFLPNTNQYFFSLLMLHLPFRDEKELLHPYENAKEAFMHKYDNFCLKDIEFES